MDANRREYKSSFSGKATRMFAIVLGVILVKHTQVAPAEIVGQNENNVRFFSSIVCDNIRIAQQGLRHLRNKQSQHRHQKENKL